MLHVDPAGEYLPTAQAAQVVAVGPNHRERKGTVQYVLAGQLTQSLEVVEPVMVPYFPCWQSMQTVRPGKPGPVIAVLDHRPTPQGRHSAEPTPGANLPLGQSSQPVRRAFEIVPGAQSKHADKPPLAA